MPTEFNIKPEEIRCVERHLRRGVSMNEIAFKTNMSYHKVRKIQRDNLPQYGAKDRLKPPHQLQDQRTPDPENTYAQNCLGDPAKARSALGQKKGIWRAPDDPRPPKPRPLVAQIPRLPELPPEPKHLRQLAHA